MLTIAAIAQQSGVNPHTVRYYVREKLITPTTQAKNSYRLFTPQDVERLHFIRSAKMLGFTLNEIRQILLHAEQGDSPCASVRQTIQQRIIENQQKIQAMQHLQSRMEQALALWENMEDGSPDAKHICPLIESIHHPQ